MEVFQVQIMWAIDFCAKRSSECVQMAEECADADQRRAWLELAREWVKLSEEVVARNYGRGRRNVSREPQGRASSDA
jgi:hypothetical protein